MGCSESLSRIPARIHTIEKDMRELEISILYCGR